MSAIAAVRSCSAPAPAADGAPTAQRTRIIFHRLDSRLPPSRKPSSRQQRAPTPPHALEAEEKTDREGARAHTTQRARWTRRREGRAPPRAPTHNHGDGPPDRGPDPAQPAAPRPHEPVQLGLARCVHRRARVRGWAPTSPCPSPAHARLCSWTPPTTHPPTNAHTITQATKSASSKTWAPRRCVQGQELAPRRLRASAFGAHGATLAALLHAPSNHSPPPHSHTPQPTHNN